MAKSKTKNLEPGDQPVGEAMRLAVEALGPLRVDPDTAAEQLLALGAAYDEVERTRVALERKLEAAKTAKAAYEVAVDHILGLVKTASHPEPLPLFDVQQAERDHAAMTGRDPKGALMAALKEGGLTRPNLQLFLSGENVEIWMTLHEGGREWVRLGCAPTLAEACDAAVDELIGMIHSIYAEREAMQNGLDNLARHLGIPS